MTDKPLDLDELDRLEKTAHGAPWISHFDGAVYQRYERGERDIFARGSFGTPANAAFIAALRNAAPALIAAARERDALRAKLNRAREAAVIAVTPLEAMSLAGTLRTFGPEMQEEIQRGIEAVRAILVELDADQPKEKADDHA